MTTPDVSIGFQSEPSLNDSLALSELRDSLLQSGIAVEALTKPWRRRDRRHGGD
jgi:hypothetical protein